MTAMVGTVLRDPRGSWLPVVCCAVLTAAALVGGCARAVTGTARAGDPEAGPARPIPVADLLIEPTRFPAQYPAAVLPPKDVDRVLREIDGVPAGSEVTPPECAPLPVLTPSSAAVQGTDDESGAASSSRSPGRCPRCAPGSTQLADCPSFTSTAGGDAARCRR